MVVFVVALNTTARMSVGGVMVVVGERCTIVEVKRQQEKWEEGEMPRSGKSKVSSSDESGRQMHMITVDSRNEWVVNKGFLATSRGKE